MKSQVLHTVWCNISGEAAGEILNSSLLVVIYQYTTEDELKASQVTGMHFNWHVHDGDAVSSSSGNCVNHAVRSGVLG